METTTDPAWEARLEAAWAGLDDELDDERFRAGIDRLARELPDASPVADFERAAAFDSTGMPESAVPLYQRALAGGLAGLRRRRATIQLASSLRNLGRIDDSLSLLTEELDVAPELLDAQAAELEPAVHGFLALALTDAGREREAVMHALVALAPLLPRYQRSLANYARDLMPAR